MGEKEHANSMLIIVIINNVSRFVGFDEKRKKVMTKHFVCMRVQIQGPEKEIVYR